MPQLNSRILLQVSSSSILALNSKSSHDKFLEESASSWEEPFAWTRHEVLVIGEIPDSSDPTELLARNYGEL